MDFGKKHKRKTRGRGRRARDTNTYNFDFSLPVDNNDDYLLLSEQELSVRQEFLDQVTEAFSCEPSMAAVIHGRRRIQLGKRGSSRSGFFPSWKNSIGGLGAIYLPMDSRPEARHAMELERNRSIQAFRTQAIEVSIPGSNRSAFPDFLVLDVYGRISIDEVKADKRFLGKQDQDDLQHLANKLERWGIGFRVVDLHDMPSDNKYKNLQWLHQRVQSIPDEFDLAAFLGLEFERSTYSDLKMRSLEIGLNESVLAYALFTELLQADWGKSLDDHSEVWR